MIEQQGGPAYIAFRVKDVFHFNVKDEAVQDFRDREESK